MSVCGTWLVDRILKPELLNDSRRSEIKHLSDDRSNVCIRLLALVSRNGATAVRVHEHTHRLSHANGIRYLHKTLFGHTRSHKILGYVSGRISCRPVNFGWILSGKGTATMSSASTVCVHYDFTPCKSGISGRSANHKLSGRIDMKDEIVVKQGRGPVRKRRYKSRYDNLADVFFNTRLHIFIRIKLIMLRADHDGMYPDRAMFLRELDSKLGFCIRAQIRHQLRLIVPYIGQHSEQLV